ncbi:hypothetical protein K0017_05155 [Staphylococcus massiliensis]|uniref:hypothetical protein n=1 Tax=Staphylococcus massiliensis TaxID=555791 RepID=UPI001EDD788A|nr:hypothetical protein [Staphylococcus massiliensis]MCG3401707.1 hypothetical protein [Staphylococcus massiliensis]
MKRFIQKVKNKLSMKKDSDLLVIKVKDPNTTPIVIFNGERLNFISYAKFIIDQPKSNYGPNMSVDFKVEHYTKQKDAMGRIDTKGFKSMR